MALLDRLFMTKFLSKSLWTSKSFKNSYQRMHLSKTSIICTVRYVFLHNLDSQSDFDKNSVTTKVGKVETFLS